MSRQIYRQAFAPFSLECIVSGRVSMNPRGERNAIPNEGQARFEGSICSSEDVTKMKAAGECYVANIETILNNFGWREQNTT
jgi:hypothetical protein